MIILGMVFFCDGLSINGWDGISFCTGSNTRLERMRIHNSGNVSVSNNFTVNSTINCTTAFINGNCTALKYYCDGETYSYTVNWNGTSASGLFVSLNQFWYTGHAYLKVAIYVQNVGANDILIAGLVGYYFQQIITEQHQQRQEV